jgi:hypothetical protein
LDQVLLHHLLLLLHHRLLMKILVELVVDKGLHYHQDYLVEDLLEVYFLFHQVELLEFLHLLHYQNLLVHQLENNKVHIYHLHHQLQ